MHPFFTNTTSVVLLLLSKILACAAPPSKSHAQYQPDEVIVVGAGGYIIYQDCTKYSLSAPIGDIKVHVYCHSGSIDVSCREDAQSLLKQFAAQQGTNLAVIVDESILYSNPSQWELSATLYRIHSLP